MSADAAAAARRARRPRRREAQPAAVSADDWRCLEERAGVGYGAVVAGDVDRMVDEQRNSPDDLQVDRRIRGQLERAADEVGTVLALRRRSAVVGDVNDHSADDGIERDGRSLFGPLCDTGERCDGVPRDAVIGRRHTRRLTVRTYLAVEWDGGSTVIEVRERDTAVGSDIARDVAVFDAALVVIPGSGRACAGAVGGEVHRLAGVSPDGYRTGESPLVAVGGLCGCS